MPPFYTWIVTVLLPIVLAVLGSSWVGDLIKDYREKKNGKVTTNEIMEAVKGLKSEIDQDRAITSRVRILRFNDELRAKTIFHSKESYDQALSDIDNYERYCEEHHDFINNKTVMSVKNIKKNYQERLEKNDFI